MRQRDYIFADPAVAIDGLEADRLWRRAARHEFLDKDVDLASLWKARVLDFRGPDIKNARSLTAMTCLRYRGRLYLGVPYPAPIGPMGLCSAPGEPPISDILMIPSTGDARMWSGRKLAQHFDPRKWALHFARERHFWLRAKALRQRHEPWTGLSAQPIIFDPS